MRDVLGSGALAVIEATVAAGASAAAAKKWWVGEISRRANAAGLELAEMAITPEQVAQLDALLAVSYTHLDVYKRQLLDRIPALPKEA